LVRKRFAGTQFRENVPHEFARETVKCRNAEITRFFASRAAIEGFVLSFAGQ